MIITIDPLTDTNIVAAAQFRHNAMRQKQIKNQIVDVARPALENEIAGCRAEAAVRMALNLPFDYETLANNQSDSGIDIQIGKLTIDVKWSHFNNGKLIFVNAWKFRANSAILVVPHNSVSLKIVGCISRKRFLEDYEWLVLQDGQRPVMAVSQDKLSPLIKLEMYLNKEKTRGPLCSNL